MEKLIDKKGYLNRDFMFYHLSDRKSSEQSFHFHEFDKIVVLLSGKASYVIEGKEYFLTPGDILLVNHHDIHMPLIDPNETYDRVVIWINRDFISSHSTPASDLSLAFKISREKDMSLLPVPDDQKDEVRKLLLGLEASFNSKDFGSDILSKATLTEFMVLINRLAMMNVEYDYSELYRCDKKIAEVIRYINEDPSKDISIDFLADKFFISKSYLMHKFKIETGYSLHNYILQKRLLYSKQLLLEGIPVSEAAERSGFAEYTTYLRAFKRLFKSLPSEY